MTFTVMCMSLKGMTKSNNSRNGYCDRCYHGTLSLCLHMIYDMINDLH